jgi:lysophospholipase L1-like esterase
MLINGKVTGPDGKVDERASATVFSETAGAMHPSAEGHAAMADAILIDIRRAVALILRGE